ncbi:hypothetical protein ACP4OV_009089 [Aristida adscensionis]
MTARSSPAAAPEGTELLSSPSPSALVRAALLLSFSVSAETPAATHLLSLLPPATRARREARRGAVPPPFPPPSGGAGQIQPDGAGSGSVPVP